MSDEDRIERRIVTGMIVSDSFLKDIFPVWDISMLQSASAQRLASWCVEYYEKYDKAPGRDIEGIYLQKLRDGLPAEIADDIEEDILPDLSREYDRETFNVQYLMDQTRNYFKERNLTMFADQIKAMTQTGNISGAEQTASDYKPIVDAFDSDLELNSEEALNRIDAAFNLSEDTVITYPGAMGKLLNPQLVRGGFVAFQAPEKRGKTFLLMDMAVRATKQGSNVAFFQAGDMTEYQQLRRLCIYLAKKSDLPQYCGSQKVPVLDCSHNFNDSCDRPERKGCGCINERVVSNKVLSFIKSKIEELDDLLKENKDYKPCYIKHCPKFLGSVWYRIEPGTTPLSKEEAKGAMGNFFNPKSRVIKRKRGRFKLSTYSSGTLTNAIIRSVLGRWEKEDGFVVDVIIVDYADLLDDPTSEFRHKQNEIWKGLRRHSQDFHALVITATQADADSYDHDSVQLKNYSEDKRKYGHITAIYGLSQDSKGIEKKLGIMRINELLIREGESDQNRHVNVLQCLQKGQPFLGSFISYAP